MTTASRYVVLLLLAGCASPQEEWRAAALELGGACAEASFGKDAPATYPHSVAMELLTLCDNSYRDRSAEELKYDAARVRELSDDR